MSSTSDPLNKRTNRLNTIGAAQNIIRNRGVKTLFTGLRLHLVRDTIGSGVFFGVYESCKQALGSYYGDEIHNNPWAIPVAGIICSVSSWMVVSLHFLRFATR